MAHVDKEIRLIKSDLYLIGTSDGFKISSYITRKLYYFITIII